MTVPFADCAAQIETLHDAVLRLEQYSRILELPALAGREWFQLLEQKLRPQMSESAFLIAAVVGGTNIGKSVVFNHMAGTTASAVSPLASGTRHPVCLVPRGFEERHDLAALFPGFELQEWSSPEAALRETDQDILFWRSSEAVPSNLLVLDTPDIDSDARINWERADRIRRAADVLVAVLTQQKYNDAAVKEFFRRAAEEDRFVLTVFNQVHLPDDEDIWPLWLRTFCDETGINPGFVYLAPHDRKAAESNHLPFFERQWPRPVVSQDAVAKHAEDADAQVSGRVSVKPAAASQNAGATLQDAEVTHPHSNAALLRTDSSTGINAGRQLREDLSSLHFGEIKLRTLRGSLELVAGPSGLPAWLHEIKARSAQYRTAAEVLCAHKLAEVENWPAPPNRLLVQTIRSWWQAQRSGWSATVHLFYNRVGQELTGSWQKLKAKMSGPATSPAESYREREWSAILSAIDAVFERLNWFRELGNPLLQPRLTKMLGATTRADLLHALRREHLGLDVEAELRELVTNELETFRTDNPAMYRSLRHLDSAAAAVRPVTTIALFVTGFGPLGHAVGQFAAHSMVASAVTMAGDVAAGSLTAAVGETWLSSSASTGMGWLEARFRRIHQQFTTRRAQWLAERLQTHLLGSLPEDLQHAALLAESDAFRDVERLTNDLQTFLRESL